MDKEALLQAIETLENQRTFIGDTAVNTAIAALQSQLKELGEDEFSIDHEGERKLITIMFADLSGFTAISQEMDPEALYHLMNMTFERLAQVIIKYGGFIAKYIGDEIMAIFGAPISYEDHAERALRASLEMMNVLEEFNQNHQSDLGLHIGINTGLVVTGMVGDRSQKQYDVTGEAVNLAARLKQLSTQGEVYVGQETYRLTQRLFTFVKLPLKKLKGLSEVQQIFHLLNIKAAPKQRWKSSVFSPLVGREVEMSILFEAHDSLKNGKGGIVSVVGEAGIGKSRLISEFEEGSILPFTGWKDGVYPICRIAVICR